MTWVEHDEDEPAVVVCARIEDLPVPHVKTATRDVCFKCQAPVWVSPGTRATYENGLDAGEEWLGVVCMQCALEMAEVSEEELYKMAKTSPQILAEVLSVVAEVAEEGEHQDHDEDDPDHVATASTEAEDGTDQQEDQQQTEQVHG